VRAGGDLVLTMRSGVKDWSNRVTPTEPPGALAALAGLTVRDYDCLRGVEQGVRWVGTGRPETPDSPVLDDRAAKWADIVEPGEAERGVEGRVETLAVYTRDFYANSPAVTRHDLGRGRVYYVGTELDRLGHEKLARVVCEGVGVAPLLATGEEVEVVRRRGAGEDLFFVLNHGAERASVEVPAGWSPVLAPEGFRGRELRLEGFDLAVYSAATGGQA
jgi:beta-galactosidase